jgi:Rrf2 family nitric oxide-sensitive transcriptional repressor
MRLTVHTDYCLRVLIYAGLKGDALSTIAEIAEHFGISKNHLMKVVHELGRKGYIETIRGKNGGLRLLLEPHRLNVGKLVRDVEEDLGVVICLRAEGFCPIEHQCVLRNAVREATAAFLGALDRYTLADLIGPSAALARLLSLERPVQALGLR